MKRYLILCAALSLTACAPMADIVGNNGTAISNAADKTTLDEQAGIDATAAYVATSKLGYVLAKNGLIDKAAFKAADNKGYAAVQVIHDAYETGNAANYMTAIAKAKKARDDIAALVPAKAK